MPRTSWIKKRSLFYVILLILLLIHGSVLMMRLHLDQKKFARDVAKPMKVKITKLSPKEFRKQIVQSEDSERKEKVDDALLSDKDRSFDRQSVAKKIDIFKEGAKSGGAPAKQGEPKKDIKLSDLGANVGEKHPLMKAAEDYNRAKKGEGPDNAVNRQVSSTNDYLKDIPPGDMTQLNTAEYKYYGFYHRVRQKLEQFWGRSIQEKAEQLIKQGRRVPASEELITSLEITLNRLGEIIDIRLIGTSGVRELDDAAVEAFNEAGPFPNPPQGLVKNGRVTIEWGFVVST